MTWPWPCATGPACGPWCSASSPGGKGVALVAAVAPDSGLNAAELIADAARTVGGGGGKGADLAVAGGREPERLDEALDQVRAQLGLA